MAYTYVDYHTHSFFNLSYFAITVIILLIFDWRVKINLNTFFFSFVIFIFYVEIIFTSFTISHNLYKYIIILFLITLIIAKELITIKVINTFMVILTISILCFFKKNQNKIEIKSLVNKSISKINQPLLIILLDEYSSPNEIKIDNLLIDYLRIKKYKIIDPTSTKETFTINSIASLLNYDISENTIFLNKLSEIERFELINNSIFEKDLNKIGIKLNLKNYYRNDNLKFIVPNFFMCPRNFVELIFYKSFIPRIERNILGEYSFQIYNKILFDDLENMILENGFKNNNVYFYHFAMPHAPYSYLNEFKKSSNYIEYYSFVNKKIISYLKLNEKNKEIKILLMGDHGLRNRKDIDPKKTFSAFQNFENKKINIIHTQDIGKIIIQEYLR